MQISSEHADKSRHYLATEIFNHQTAQVFGTLQYALGIATIFLTSWLIYAIHKKTPFPMLSLKKYLIPYCICIICIEIAFNLYMPFMLHPFAYFYPTGLAVNFPKPLGIFFIGIGYVSSVGLLDCNICILLERFFALRNIHNMTQEPSKYPKIYFGIAISSAALCTIGGLIILLVPSLNNFIMLSPDEASNLANSTIIGLDAFIDLEKLLIVRGSTQNYLPYYIILVGLFASARIFLALMIIVVNSIMTQILKYHIPPNLQRTNKMILKMSIIQFLNFGLTVGGPVFCICMIYWFATDPYPLINYGLGSMHWFGILDSAIMIVCIKPYYTYFIQCFGRLICYKKAKIVVITSVHLTEDYTASPGRLTNN